MPGHQKDFDGWNERKKFVDSKESLFCHEREIWWCVLGVNIGFEENGTGHSYRRPVLILKPLSAQTSVAVPLTTSRHIHPLRFWLGNVVGKDASAVLSQFRVIDTRRLTQKMGTLDPQIFEDIRKTIKDML